MKKIIFYSVAFFGCLMVWLTIFHAQLIVFIEFDPYFEFWRSFTKNTAMVLAFVFIFLLAYECFKKDKHKK